MDVITDDILIGNYLDAQDLEQIAANGVKSVLSLDGTADEVDYSATEVGEVAVIRLIDGPGNNQSAFRHAVKTLRRLTSRTAPVLVQCHAGRSRSAAVVACYFMWHHGKSLADAMSEITRHREVIITAGLQEVFDIQPD